MKRVISFSGGKDSTALILWALEQGWEFETVFCDTGHEHPLTMEYIEEINQKLLGGKLITLRSKKYPGGMREMVEKKGRCPSTLARFCTVELKIEPMFAWIFEQKEDLIIYQGIRADESQARAKMSATDSYFSLQEKWEQELSLPKESRTLKSQPMRYKEVMAWREDYDCEVARPLFNWSGKQAIDFHTKHNLEPNPLYKKGAKRVGCFPCVQVNHPELKNLSLFFPEIWDGIKDLEKINNSSFFPPNYIPKKRCTGFDQESKKPFPWASDVKEYILGEERFEQLSFMEPLSCMSQYGLCE